MIAAQTDFRAPGTGLHPRHYIALRAEILRSGAEMTPDQLLDLADALHSLIRLRRPGRPIQRPDGWVADEKRAFL